MPFWIGLCRRLTWGTLLCPVTCIQAHVPRVSLQAPPPMVSLTKKTHTMDEFCPSPKVS